MVLLCRLFGHKKAIIYDDLIGSVVRAEVCTRCLEIFKFDDFTEQLRRERQRTIQSPRPPAIYQNVGKFFKGKSRSEYYRKTMVKAKKVDEEDEFDDFKDG